MMESEEDLMSFALDEEKMAVLTYSRLMSPRNRGETEHIAAMQVVLMTQAIRMRLALMHIARGDGGDRKKDVRKFAAQALEYAESFTREDLIASYKRIAKPEEH